MTHIDVVVTKINTSNICLPANSQDAERRIGRGGDSVTSASVTPAGCCRLVAMALVRMCADANIEFDALPNG